MAAALRAGRARCRRGPSSTPREPIVSVTGPSALVSWLEPLVLSWHYRIQIASLAAFEPQLLAGALASVTRWRQRELALETLDAAERTSPPMRLDADGYQARVRARVKELVELTQDPARLFEVGLRSASCVEQHLLALEACKAEGLTRTSHVFRRARLGRRRWARWGTSTCSRFGADDAAFRAMTERRPHQVELPARHVRYDEVGHSHGAGADCRAAGRGRLDSLRLRATKRRSTGSRASARRRSACGPCTFSRTRSTLS